MPIVVSVDQTYLISQEARVAMKKRLFFPFIFAYHYPFFAAVKSRLIKKKFWQK